MAIYPFCEDGQARELYTSRDLRQHTRQCCGKENFNSRECLLESARRRDEKVAERVGFEPTVRFPARSLSRRVLSTAQPPLRSGPRVNRSRAGQASAMSSEGSIKGSLQAWYYELPCQTKRSDKDERIEDRPSPGDSSSMVLPPLLSDTKISARGRRTATAT